MLSSAVEARRRELGIRVALGATRSGVLGLVFRNASSLVALGVCLGVPLAALLGRLLSSFLFGVTAGDVGAWTASLAVLLAAGAAATYVPARRALSVEPAEALRAE